MPRFCDCSDGGTLGFLLLPGELSVSLFIYSESKVFIKN